MNKELYDIKKHALLRYRSADGKKQSYFIHKAVENIDFLSLQLAEDGYWALKERCGYMPRKSKLELLLWEVYECFLTFLEPEEMLEVLATQYWVSDFSKEEAAAAYVLIQGSFLVLEEMGKEKKISIAEYFKDLLCED